MAYTNQHRGGGGQARNLSLLVATKSSKNILLMRLVTLSSSILSKNMITTILK